MQNICMKTKDPVRSGGIKIRKELLENLPPMYRMVAEYKIRNQDWELVDTEGSA